MKKAPREEPDERLNVTPPKTWATGVPAVTHALEYSLAETSVRRTGLTLLTMNQVGGIDCPGCAWADPAPGHRHVNEYCENGAKHINDEATSRRVTADFFRRHTVSGLGRRSDRWLNQQGLPPSRWSSGPARITTSRSAGTTPSDCWPTS